jgi:hypothetical protein
MKSSSPIDWFPGGIDWIYDAAVDYDNVIKSKFKNRKSSLIGV